MTAIEDKQNFFKGLLVSQRTHARLPDEVFYFLVCLKEPFQFAVYLVVDVKPDHEDKSAELKNVSPLIPDL